MISTVLGRWRESEAVSFTEVQHVLYLEVRVSSTTGTQFQSLRQHKAFLALPLPLNCLHELSFLVARVQFRECLRILQLGPKQNSSTNHHKPDYEPAGSLRVLSTACSAGRNNLVRICFPADLPMSKLRATRVVFLDVDGVLNSAAEAAAGVLAILHLLHLNASCSLRFFATACHERLAYSHAV